MATSRRVFLGGLAGLAALAGGWAGRLAARPQASAGPAGSGGDFERVLAAALNGQRWTESAAVLLEVPPLAENGAIVPITVESRLPDTTRILVFAERNPGPLLAQFRFAPGADGWVSLRIKLNETGPVLAVAESGGKFYGARTLVKVMVGGCG